VDTLHVLDAGVPLLRGALATLHALSHAHARANLSQEEVSDALALIASPLTVVLTLLQRWQEEHAHT